LAFFNTYTILLMLSGVLLTVVGAAVPHLGRTADRRAVATAAAERVRPYQQIAASKGYPGNQSSFGAPPQGPYGAGPAQHG
jgi:hypothetical protein